MIMFSVLIDYFFFNYFHLFLQEKSYDFIKNVSEKLRDWEKIEHLKRKRLCYIKDVN